MELEEYLK